MATRANPKGCLSPRSSPRATSPAAGSDTRCNARSARRPVTLASSPGWPPCPDRIAASGRPFRHPLVPGGGGAGHPLVRRLASSRHQRQDRNRRTGSVAVFRMVRRPQAGPDCSSAGRHSTTAAQLRHPAPRRPARKSRRRLWRLCHKVLRNDAGADRPAPERGGLAALKRAQTFRMAPVKASASRSRPAAVVTIPGDSRRV